MILTNWLMGVGRKGVRTFARLQEHPEVFLVLPLGAHHPQPHQLRLHLNKKKREGAGGRCFSGGCVHPMIVRTPTNSLSSSVAHASTDADP